MKSRLIAAGIAAFFVALGVLGVDTTGVANAASAVAEDTYVGYGDVVRYVDADGVTRTAVVANGSVGPRVSDVTADFKASIATKPVLVPQIPNPALAECIALHQSGEITPKQLQCAAIIAANMAQSAFGLLSGAVILPPNFTRTPLDPSANNPQAVGCAPGWCPGGYYDQVAHIWYRSGEKVGFMPGAIGEKFPVGHPSAGRYNFVFKLRLFAGTVSNPYVTGGPGVFGSHTYVWMCSTGTQIASIPQGAQTWTAANLAADFNQFPGGIFEQKTARNYILTAAQSVVADTCVNGGGKISFHITERKNPDTVNTNFTGFIYTDATPGPPGTGTIRTSIICVDKNGAEHTITNTAPSTVPLAGGTVNLPDVKCPPGTTVKERKAQYEEPGYPDTPLLRPEDSQPRPGVPEDIPENMECYDGTKVCKLELRKKDGTPCGRGAVYCPDWAKDPQAPGNYTCYFNSKAVDLNKCSSLRDPRTGPLPDHDFDGNPIPYDQVPRLDDLPEVDPETGPEVGGPGGPDTEEGRQCFPTGWSVLNPVEWVMKPVGCALQDAFVPSETAFQDAAQEIESAWADTAPGAAIAAVQGWSFAGLAPDGCHGITIDIFFLGDPLQIMNACPGSMLAPLADLSRLVGNISFAVYGVVAITRHFAAIFEFKGLGSSDS